jgi:hypothetical protein
MQSTTSTNILTDEAIAALEAQDTATRKHLATLTVAELKEVADDVMVAFRSDTKKANLIEAIATKQARIDRRKAEQEVEDADAATRGFSSAYSERQYLKARAAFQREADYDVAGEMCAAIAKHGNLLYELEWADKWAQAAARKDLAARVLGHADWYAEPKVEDREGNVTIDEARRIADPVKALEAAKQEVLAKPLLENTWRGGSTSAFHNATEAARREAADDLLHRYEYQG